MSASSIRLLVPNAIAFVRDSVLVDCPREITTTSNVWWTSSCVAVICLADVDGETEIVLGAAQEVGLSEPPAFDGEIETPSRAVIVEIVPAKTILAADVAAQRTRVRIWLSHPRWPEKVIVGLN